MLSGPLLFGPLLSPQYIGMKLTDSSFTFGAFREFPMTPNGANSPRRRPHCDINFGRCVKRRQEQYDKRLLEPTPQQAATLPKREGGREGDRVLTEPIERLFQMAISRRRNSTNLFPLTLPFREGRDAVPGWVLILRGGFPKPDVFPASINHLIQRIFHQSLCSRAAQLGQDMTDGLFRDDGLQRYPARFAEWGDGGLAQGGEQARDGVEVF